MSNVLLTGATGFIGSHLSVYLTTEQIDPTYKSHNVTTILRDLPSTRSPWGKWLCKITQNINMVHGDIVDYPLVKRVLAENNIETIIHTAAQSIVATSQKDPTTTYLTNVQGTVNLLEACRELDIPNFYLVSTDKVYGDQMGAVETDPLRPSEIYGTSKACQDLTAQAYAKTYGLNVIIGRACNTYGFDFNKRIIPNTIQKCLKKEQPIIYNGENALRQYIYVKDHASAILHLLNAYMHPRSHEQYPAIFNIGTNDILTQSEIVLSIAKTFGIAPEYVDRAKPLKEIQNQSLEFKKLINTGWRPMYTFDEAIHETTIKFEEFQHD